MQAVLQSINRVSMLSKYISFDAGEAIKSIWLTTVKLKNLT